MGAHKCVFLENSSMKIPKGMQLYNFSKASYCVLSGRCLVIWSSKSSPLTQKKDNCKAPAALHCTLLLYKSCSGVCARDASSMCDRIRMASKGGTAPRTDIATTALPLQSALTEPAGSMPVVLAAGELLLL
eukprot:CAMPEP_0204248378 /NCGR_PEP_ID=MMETSP0361-20130328/99132_1 /ASSEMBLY_ACC=CAM_ASM_000343 /TAXON_ID=268821 /ORGANISM="Scrippsiella Hangoei, Strain SHTV-5" /LENGTH=130 /DNA_ID=CAMNT_0051221639 /DNA_START=561 /DNA_END=951 /DNA_ORIENTATION=+